MLHSKVYVIPNMSYQLRTQASNALGSGTTNQQHKLQLDTIFLQMAPYMTMS